MILLKTMLESFTWLIPGQEDDPMSEQSRAKSLLAPLAFLLFLGLTILVAEGMPGFAVFLNLEALLLVFGGAFLAVWSAYSLREMVSMSDPEMLNYAADCSMGMGVLGTVLGFILMLASVNDVMMVPRRMALALTCLLFGLLLSEAILRPMAHRLGRSSGAAPASKGSSGMGGRRLFLAALGLGTAFSSLFAVLYAMQAALCSPSIQK
jgi:hypothetical protein